ncbi:MAG: hypothetical protein GF329_18630 [Candidatus Lokiarchaeota archaeon]|nr:hypothetical protein [Candidatus Lokiarchaeota archaeon]
MIWKKLFLFLGFPILIFYCIMIIIYYSFLSAVWLISLIVGLLCLRKNKFWRRATKFSISIFVCFFILISNPLYWPSQIYRHIDTSTIITPDAPAIQQLNETTEYWSYLSTNYGINQPTYKNLTEIQKLQYVEDFCFNKVIYLNIQYIWGVIDYVATPTEVLERGVGDCQHRTVVMVSFLIFLGYDAWACECPLHWYPRVFINDSTYIDLYKVNWTEPHILINNEQVKFVMNLPMRLYDTLTHFSLNDPINEFFNSFTFWILFSPISLIAAALLVLLIRTSGKQTKKKKLYNILFGTFFFIFGFLMTTLIGNFYSSLSLIILITTIILNVQLISHNFFLLHKLDKKELNESK